MMPNWAKLLDKAVETIVEYGTYYAYVTYDNYACEVRIYETDNPILHFLCSFDYETTDMEEARLMARAFMTFAYLPKLKIEEVLTINYNE